MIKKKIGVLLSLVLVSVAASFAQARECKSNFDESGDDDSGYIYRTNELVKDTTIPQAMSAVKQQLLVDTWTIKSYNVKSGMIVATEVHNGRIRRVLPLTVGFSAKGSDVMLRMSFTLPRGVETDSDYVKKQFCTLADAAIQ